MFKSAIVVLAVVAMSGAQAVQATGAHMLLGGVTVKNSYGSFYNDLTSGKSYATLASCQASLDAYVSATVMIAVPIAAGPDSGLFTDPTYKVGGSGSYKMITAACVPTAAQ